MLNLSGDPVEYAGAARRRSWPWRFLTRMVGTGVIVALTALIAGCSGSAVTGGGVPLGGTRAETSGQVVQSSSTGQVVAGASVTFQASDGTTFTTTTDANGSYFFPSVPVGPGTISVEPPRGAHLLAQRLSVVVDENALESVLVSLPPDTGPGAITGITISPPSINVHLGDRVTLTAALAGANIPLGAQPSYVVTGGVGNIIRQQVFIASHRGTGTIVALYGGQTAAVPVTVD